MGSGVRVEQLPLGCLLMNARKGVADVLDPFEIEDGWFALELIEFQVVPGQGLPADVRARVVDTINTLRLSHGVCCEARAEYAHAYWEGDIRLSYLRRHWVPAVNQLGTKGAGRSWN